MCEGETPAPPAQLCSLDCDQGQAANFAALLARGVEREPILLTALPSA